MSDLISIHHDGQEVCRIEDGAKVLDIPCISMPVEVSIFHNGELVYQINNKAVTVNKMPLIVDAN